MKNFSAPTFTPPNHLKSEGGQDNFHRKPGAAIALGGEWGLAAVLFEQSAHLLDASPVRKAFLSAIRADLSGTPLFTMRHA
jgi:hypothetical protein